MGRKNRNSSDASLGEEIPEEVHRKASILSKAIMDMPPKTQVALVADRRGKYKVKSRREYGE